MLRDNGKRRFRLSDSPPDGRRRPGKSALARACDAGSGLRVLDATAGWGTDGLALARLGCYVQMLETNPLVYAMLDDRLRGSGVRLRRNGWTRDQECGTRTRTAMTSSIWTDVPATQQGRPPCEAVAGLARGRRGRGTRRIQVAGARAALRAKPRGDEAARAWARSRPAGLARGWPDGTLRCVSAG